MIRMKDEHVVVIINDTLSSTCEVTDDMHKRARSAWSIEPSLS